MSQQNPMSKRMFGVGIILTGLLVLAVALIMGLEFPRYVYDKNLKDLCILDSRHRLYTAWLNDTFRSKSNQIWYWELRNKDAFLYRGAAPQYVERGPYVYMEHQEKVDISFTVGTVQFYLRRWQTFDTRRTKKQCGAHCTEDDNITLLNTDYFKRVGKFGSDVKLALHLSPSTLRTAIDDVTNWNGGDVFDTFRLLGRLNDTLIDSWVSFGSWVSLADTTPKRLVLEHRGGSDFSTMEMAGLYRILTDPILLGATEDLLSSTSYVYECNVNSNVPSAESTSSDSPETVLYETQPPACSFLACLDRYVMQQQLNVQATTSNLTETLNRYLCGNSTTACFLLPDTPVYFRAYVSTIHEYLYKHVTRLALYRNIHVQNRDIILTRPQSELALGYFTVNMTGVEAGKEKYFVPGILEHTDYKTDVRWKSKQYSLYNCYDSVDGQTNFHWKAYDGRSYATRSQFPKASPADRRVFSHRRNLPPGKDLRTCEEYQLSEGSYDFFIPEYWRKMPFDVTDDDDIRGKYVQTLRLNQSSFIADGVYVETDGLQDMQGTFGYRGWLSLPHFLYAERDLAEYFDMSPSINTHSMMMKVEPVTGAVWASSVRYQHNLGIIPDYVSVTRHQVAFSINDTALPLPVYWVDSTFTYTAAGEDEYDDRSGRLLRASCGGLIGMSFLACLIVLTGILAGTVTIRSGRVMPVNEEEAL